MIYSFKIFPKEWEVDSVNEEDQKEIFKDIFRKEEIYKQSIKADGVDKYSLYTILKEKTEYVLKDKCKFDVRKEITDEHEFFCVMASEEILKKEADRINFKLRFTKEADAEGYSHDMPAYAPFDFRYHQNAPDIF